MLLTRLKNRTKRFLYSNYWAFSFFEAASFKKSAPVIQQAIKDDRLKLHLGCAGTLLEGWQNLDLRLGDEIISARLPQALRRFPSDSARYIYTSHFMEHIEYPGEVEEFARQCHRIFKNDGVIRIVVPDIQSIIEAYVAKDEGFFEVQASLHPKWCETPLDHLMYALQQDGEHKYGYDFETICKPLRKAGFREVTLSDFQTSNHPELLVDYRDTKDNHGRYLSLFVEAVK